MKKLTSLRWTLEMASKEFNIDRKTLSKRLRQADIHLNGSDGRLSTKQIVEALFGDIHNARQRLLQSQTALNEHKLAEREHDLIPAWEMANFVQSIWAVLRSEIDSWHVKEAGRRQLGQRLHEVCLAAAKVCGVDTTEAEGKLKEDVEKLKKELAAGTVPDFWFDPYEPENKCRVWSQDLGRYYTRKEIVEKFGEGGQVSPIDKILEEEGVMPVSKETQRIREQHGAPPI